MSQTIATREAMLKAAETLRANGEEVTYRSIKKMVKGGSPQTICDWLREYRRTVGEPPESPNTGATVPEPVARIAAELVAAVIAVARADAKKQSDAVAAVASKDVAEIKQDLALACADVDTADQELATVIIECDRLREASAELTSQVATCREDVQQARASNLAAGAREAEVQRLATALQSELDRAHRSIDVERGEYSKLREQLGQLQTELALTQAALAYAKEGEAAANAAANDAKRHAVLATSEAYAKVAGKIDAITAGRDGALADARTQGELAHKLRGELEAVRQKSDELLALLGERRHKSSAGPLRRAKANAT